MEPSPIQKRKTNSLPNLTKISILSISIIIIKFFCDSLNDNSISIIKKEDTHIYLLSEK
jgi:hypothetical protein